MNFEKLNKYVKDFLLVCNSFLEIKEFYTDKDKEFILIEPEKFKIALKEICIGDVNESLKIYRDLCLITTEKNRFTVRKKIKNKYRRLIAIKINTFNRLRGLTKN